MGNLSTTLERRFHLQENGTNVRTELLAGVTTFATMSYVLATIPNMLELIRRLTPVGARP